MRYKLYVILVILVMMITSCKKEGSEFRKDSYPLKVGNWWRYQIVDFFGSQRTDTVTLKIVSSIANGSAKDFKCDFIKKGAIVDSGHFILTDTALSYNGSNPHYSLWGFFNLKLPFSSGEKWEGIYPTDTIRVTGRSASLKILGRTYSPDYTLARRISVPQLSLIQIIEVTPNVGIIYQSINLHSDTAVWVQEDIQLIDFKLN